MSDLLTDVRLYSLFLTGFFWRRLEKVFLIFQTMKYLIVALLIEKRGRYVRSFAHTTLIGTMMVALVLAPLAASSLRSSARAEDVVIENMILDETLNPAGDEIDPLTYVSDKPRSTITVYTVQTGDTLSTIAAKFGISVDTIKWENDLKTDKIKPGQKLRILPVTGVSHRVKKGETIYSIAKKYKTSPQAIVDFPFNYFQDEDVFALEVGQLLIVPDGVKPEKKTPVRRQPYIQGPVPDAIGRFLWPTSGVITQRYQWYHRAVDIANPAGPGIKAADDGVVIYAGWTRNKGGYGLHVIIRHNNGYQTLYAHMRQIKVSTGDKVVKGQIIGLMGSTGRSTGTHVHFEILRNGRRLNPLGFFK